MPRAHHRELSGHAPLSLLPALPLQEPCASKESKSEKAVSKKFTSFLKEENREEHKH